MNEKLELKPEIEMELSRYSIYNRVNEYEYIKNTINLIIEKIINDINNIIYINE